MALDAGSVFTVLGARFDGAGYREKAAADKATIASSEAAESRIGAANGRVAASHEKVASSARSVAESTRRVGESLPLRAMDQWDRQSAKAAKNLDTLGRVSAKTAGVGVLALGAGMVYAAAKATTFNREMLKIATQAGGTTQEVTKLKGEVLQLAGTVPQGPQKLAEGLYHLESAGFRGTKAMELLTAAAKGAALGNSELEATTQAMISVVASQIGGVKGASDAMGQLNDIVGVGDVRMEDLAKAMGSSGLLPVAAHFGLTLKDVGAMIATTTDNATPAAVTLTRLRMAISLLGASSPKATKELATIGIGSKQLAEDMRRPNGGLVAIEDLAKHLKDSGKTATEQAQLVSKAFGGGRSSAGITLLLDEINRLQSKYKQLGASDPATKLAKSWAQFQKSEAGAFGELKSGAEAFAITVGNVVMPTLKALSQEASKALGGFVQSGGAEHLGQALASGFSAAGEAIGKLVSAVRPLAEGLLNAGRAVSSLASSMGLGLSGQLATLAAGFLAFKGAMFLAPMLAAVASGIAELSVAAATAPTIAAFAADLVALTGPAGLVAAAVAVAAAAFVALDSGLFSSASAAERNASAMQADKKSIEDLNHATTEAASSELELKQAKLDHKNATHDLRKAEKEYADGKISALQLEQAQINAQRTGLRVQEQAKTTLQRVNTERAKAEGATNVNSKREGELQQEKGQVEGVIKRLKEQGAGKEALRAPTEKLNSLEAEYNDTIGKQAKLMAQISVAEISRNRLKHGQEAITPKNAPGVNQLQIALSGLPSKIVTKYELADQDTLAKLGTLSSKLEQIGQGTTMVRILTTAPSASAALAAMKAVLAGVPAAKVLRILHNAPSARAAIEQLASAVRGVPSSKRIDVQANVAAALQGIASVQAAVAAVQGKTIELKVEEVMTRAARKAGHAAGRGPGSGMETALVGEGRGPEWVIDSLTGAGRLITAPTVVGLAPEDYVIPTEPRYRGRAWDLLQKVAGDLMPGYKAGKKGKGKAGAGSGPSMPIPSAIPPLSLPLSDIEGKESEAKSHYEKAATKVHSLEGQLKTAERNLKYASSKGTAKAKDHAKVSELRSELGKARSSHDYVVEHRKMQEWERTLREAKAFQTQINKRHAEVENAANQMRIASNQGNVGAYDAARTRRLGALKGLQSLIALAQQQVKTGTEYALSLEGQVQQAQIETESTEGEGIQNAAAEAEERSGMTEAEEKEQKHIEAGVALAALTPGLTDDQSAAGELVSFFRRVLGEAQAEPGARGGDETIRNLAQSLKSAESNVESFAGKGSNENADVQAQLTQAEARAETEAAKRQTAEQALAVFGGTGDIGAGGPNARGAVTQNIYTLHPGDPQTLRAIGTAATAGMGYQGSRRATTLAVGP